ncbi:unnamed protein product [Protopolystoma xenopodis]|uniref:Uncharacterized protein n=1 Tax=Protopolystoma xenopodis TaxID=117903 RepID=A0A448WR59_9PLAT|nr:unnamed protein product [Protopolystoma xenopodis]
MTPSTGDLGAEMGREGSDRRHSFSPIRCDSHSQDISQAMSGQLGPLVAQGKSEGLGNCSNPTKCPTETTAWVHHENDTFGQS